MSPLVPSPGERDVYANLLREPRRLRQDQVVAKDAWFASLPGRGKERTLFELEVLLKGLGCLGNRRNHPGPIRRVPDVAHNFEWELRLVRRTMERCVRLASSLLGERDRAFSFARYLESVIPEDATRSQLVRDQLAQDTPEESLFLLRLTLSGAIDIAEGLLNNKRIDQRVFYATHAMVVREIDRNAFFCPLTSLEFRPEFDRIRNPQALEALDTVSNETAHRLLALTLLTLFRGLRYLRLSDQYVTAGVGPELALVVLAVLRSEVIALTQLLNNRCSEMMSEGFGQQLLCVPATDLRHDYDELLGQAEALTSLRHVFESVSNTLGVEIRQVMEHELPGAGGPTTGPQWGAQVVVATAALRATLQDATHRLCLETHPGTTEPPVADEAELNRLSSDRLRRDIWIFAQVLRAFVAKAEQAPQEVDSWRVQTGFQFVHEFLQHFKSIGYQLVRRSDYERLNPLLQAVERLRDFDPIDERQLSMAAHECRALLAFLHELFQRVSGRTELSDTPFDKKRAADALRIYLHSATKPGALETLRPASA